jgi:hypothetical protein
MSLKNRQVLLASRPTGEPTPDNFRLAEADAPRPGPGQMLLRTVYLSLDPSMRPHERRALVRPAGGGRRGHGGPRRRRAGRARVSAAPHRPPAPPRDRRRTVFPHAGRQAPGDNPLPVAATRLCLELSVAEEPV